jgi:N-methylhydantoinase A
LEGGHPIDGARPEVDLLAADVGGTFTDVIGRYRDGTTTAIKLPSTPPAFEAAILAAAAEIGANVPVARLAHGTTVATNALLEGTGSRTALVTTEGFRDILELARLRRPSLFDLHFVKPPPLVPRDRRFEIRERTTASGEVLAEPNRDDVLALAGRLADLDVEAVSICLLNSYANPRNELQVRDWLVAAMESLARPVVVTASSEIQREIREFERTSTAVINSYVAPTVSRYLNRLSDGMAASHGTGIVQIMQSNGALIESELAARFPCRLIESGPAAGVLAAAALVADINEGNAIAFDMGGTTAKAALIESGRPFETVQLEVGGSMNRDGASMSGSGYVIRAPSLDISEVGAGGGSIVWLDATGAPRVGPRSAGASPGPVCYGQGGSEPTVTDANLVLGYLGADGIAGGRVSLRPDLAAAALSERIAVPLGLEVADAAWGVHVLANVGMEAALRAVSVERGRSPTDYVLVAYGGAGPMHAATLASAFDMTAVVIPPRAGLLCAHGLTLAKIRQDAVRAYPFRMGVDRDLLAGIARELGDELRLELGGETAAPVELSYQLAVRYAGQPTELLILLDPATDLAEDTLAVITNRFLVEHRRTYGYADAHAPMEIVSVRAAATRLAGALTDRFPSHRTDAAIDRTPISRRPAYFGPVDGWFDTPVFADRRAVKDLAGPLIVEEADATVVVAPGWRVDCDPADRLRLTREAM